MSWFFPTQSTGSHQAGEDASDALDQDVQPGGYFTDGVELYRSLGAITLGPCQMIGLENCRSLDVILIAADELRRRQHPVRPVIPAIAASGP
ncbi:MAG: hypothetical protein ACXVUL_21695 [Solirubrobacteraceae bacterium]